MTDDEFLDALQNWAGLEMSALHGTPAARGEGLLMGLPVWGQTYLNRFSWYCLPSLLAEKNLAVLRGRCRLVLFTDRPTFPKLERAMKGMERDAGIEVLIREIPLPVMQGIVAQRKGAPIDYKYFTLGVAGQLAMQMAGRAGMAMHMLMPDHVYAHEYFPNLLRLSEDYEAIAQPGISATISEEVHGALYAFKQPDGSLAIPDRDLGDIGWRFMHPQTKYSLITDDVIPNNLPMSHLWTWQGRDRLYLSCCHMNAAYLSPAMCARAPLRIPATVDAELPAFFPEKFYVPKADDGLTYIELSDASKPHSTERGDLEAFVACCSEKVRYSEDWMPFAREIYEVPIHEQETFTEEAKVKHQHAWLLAQLRDDKPSLKARAAYRLIQSLAFRGA